jgi:hypothetical protein
MVFGLMKKSHSLCLIGRFFIGLSDTMTILQRIILCIWFPPKMLPMALGIMLFLTKAVRAINDNLASIIYN